MCIQLYVSKPSYKVNSHLWTIFNSLIDFSCGGTLRNDVRVYNMAPTGDKIKRLYNLGR